MATGGTTAFVTGADEFLGAELVKVLIARGHYGTAGNRYAWTTRFIVDPTHTGCRHADAVFANIRLRGTGFTFHYLTLEEGVRQIVSTLHE